MEATLKKQDRQNTVALWAALVLLFAAAIIYSSKVDDKENLLSRQNPEIQSPAEYGLTGSI